MPIALGNPITQRPKRFGLISPTNNVNFLQKVKSQSILFTKTQLVKGNSEVVF